MDKINLNKAIEQFLAEKTFSVEAMEAVKELQEKYDDLLLDNEHTEEELEKTRNTTSELLDKVTDLERQITDWKALEQSIIDREIDVSKREVKVDLIQQESNFNSMRVNDLKETIAIVFKNPTFKRTVFGHKPMEVHPGQNGSNGYPQSMQFNEDETITEE